MILVLTSFLAGLLTILAPCVVAFVPVILARTATNNRRPWVVLTSLAVSVIVFSILLKSTTLLIDVSPRFWGVLSGVIIIVFGLITLRPQLWERLSSGLGFSLRAQHQFAKASGKSGFWGDVVIGASMGPIFSACSPTYALIVATILPAEPLTGLLYLLSYVAGLSFMLVLVMMFGRKLTQKLGWGINPESGFHKILGVILIIIGVAIATSLDKTLLTFLLEQGLFDWQINLESGLTTQ